MVFPLGARALECPFRSSTRQDPWNLDREVLAMGPVAIQASWSLVNLHQSLESKLDTVDNDQDRERRLQMNMNTCHVWKEDGQHIQLIKMGRRAPLPDWESKRLVELGVEVPKL